MEKSMRGNSINRTVCFKMDERKKLKDLFYATLKQTAEKKI